MLENSLVGGRNVIWIKASFEEFLIVSKLFSGTVFFFLIFETSGPSCSKCL